jgi:2-hydroxychromene-2-carboxylate isomerase
MTLRIECFWSFRSPYSYLLVPRLAALVHDFDVACAVRIVRPIAVRQPTFFSAGDPLWITYLMRDTKRVAAYLGMPYRWPRPDPVVMDMATRTYPVEQPYIHRLNHLGQLASERGHGLAFIEAVSRLIWNGRTDDWHLGDHLARAAAEAGLDLAEMDRALDRDGDRLAAAIEANERDQRAAGHYGVPLMAFDGEPFFGQDRFDQLVRRLEQAGLARRPHGDARP